MTVALEPTTWSKSQASAFRECRRKGVLSNGHALNAADNNQNPLIQEAQRLKRLKNRHLWAGSLVHDTMGQLLKMMSQGVTLPAEEFFVGDVRKKMRDEYKNSQQNPGMDGRLFEHEYSISVPPEMWRRHWETVETSIRGFYHSAWMKRMRDLGPESWKAVNEVLEFEMEGVRAYVKIDCALEANGRFVLIDWKSSSLRPEDDKNLQAAALYAHEVWDAAPDAIDAFVVSLTDGLHRWVPINEETLIDTVLRIQEEAGMLQENLEGAADPMSVPMTTDLGRCQRCNFQKLCHTKTGGRLNAA